MIIRTYQYRGKPFTDVNGSNPYYLTITTDAQNRMHVVTVVDAQTGVIRHTLPKWVGQTLPGAWTR